MRDHWTDKRIATLTEMWKAGISARDIGKELGVTRNAVIGKVHRCGLSMSDRPKKERSKSADQRSPKPVRRSAFLPLPDAPLVPPERHDGELVSLQELRSDHCRWPIGDPGTAGFGFCGDRRLAAYPYCAKHCEQAYAMERR